MLFRSHAAQVGVGYGNRRILVAEELLPGVACGGEVSFRRVEALGLESEDAELIEVETTTGAALWWFAVTTVRTVFLRRLPLLLFLLLMVPLEEALEAAEV